MVLQDRPLMGKSLTTGWGIDTDTKFPNKFSQMHEEGFIKLGNSLHFKVSCPSSADCSNDGSGWKDKEFSSQSQNIEPLSCLWAGRTDRGWGME